jgi:hypothetical protein
MRKVVALAAIALLLTGCAKTPTHKPISVKDGITVDASGLTVGMCLSEEAATGAVGITQKVDCAKPHFGEVMSEGKITLPGDKFDEKQIAGLANEYCIKSFGTFAGLRYDKSSLQMFPLVPTEKSWSGGDRIITCIVYDQTQLVTGTLKGANR